MTIFYHWGLNPDNTVTRYKYPERMDRIGDESGKLWFVFNFALNYLIVTCTINVIFNIILYFITFI